MTVSVFVIDFVIATATATAIACIRWRQASGSAEFYEFLLLVVEAQHYTSRAETAEWQLTLAGVREITDQGTRFWTTMFFWEIRPRRSWRFGKTRVWGLSVRPPHLPTGQRWNSEEALFGTFSKHDSSVFAP